MTVGGPVLLVLGDSLAFHGPERPEPADDPRLWPNVAAAALGVRAEIVAGTGWTARHAWHALISDPRVWAVLPAVDALVLGVGGMDTLPSPLPTALRELIPVLRPDGLRRRARAAYLRAQPVLARTFAAVLPGGGPVALPPRLTVRYLERCRSAVLAVRPDLPVVAVLPPPHRAECYASVHAGRAAAERATRAWAEASGVVLLDLPALVTDHVLGGHGNPDGMHWGWTAHAAVGEACAGLLTPVLGSAAGGSEPRRKPDDVQAPRPSEIRPRPV